MEASDSYAGRTHLWVPHYELRADDLPMLGASWSDTVSFAESFPARVVFPERELLESFAVAARHAFERDGSLPEGLTLLRAALAAERHFAHYDGPRVDPERMGYAYAVTERIRRHIELNEHVAPSVATDGGVRDAVSNAYDRLLVGYASWGGWRYHGWGGYDDGSTYLGPAIWSERDCDLKLAYELEREWPGAVHMEFPIAKWTRGDFEPPEVVQRIDVSVSALSGFRPGLDASAQFKRQRHEAFFEIKWCTKGWSTNSRELKSGRESIPVDLMKLGNNIRQNRCVVAGMVVFDDEGWFDQEELGLPGGWPAGVWRLYVGPHALRWRGLITESDYDEAVTRHRP